MADSPAPSDIIIVFFVFLAVIGIVCKLSINSFIHHTQEGVLSTGIQRGGLHFHYCCDCFIGKRHFVDRKVRGRSVLGP